MQGGSVPRSGIGRRSRGIRPRSPAGDSAVLSGNLGHARLVILCTGRDAVCGHGICLITIYGCHTRPRTEEGQRRTAPAGLSRGPAPARLRGGHAHRRPVRRRHPVQRRVALRSALPARVARVDSRPLDRGAEQRRRRVYTLTPAGRATLAGQRDGWKVFAAAVSRIAGVEPWMTGGANSTRGVRDAGLDNTTRDVVQRELEEHLKTASTNSCRAAPRPTGVVVPWSQEMPDGVAIRRLARVASPPTAPPERRRRGRPPRPTAASPLATARARSADTPGAVSVAIPRSRWRRSAPSRCAWRPTPRCSRWSTPCCCAPSTCRTAIGSSSSATSIRGPALRPTAAATPGCPTTSIASTAVPALAEQAMFRTHGVSVGDTSAERLTAITTTPSLFPMLRFAGRARPHVHRRRSDRRPAPHGRAERRPVASTLRRVPGRHRPIGRGRRRAARDRRRHAGAVPLLRRRGESVAAGGVHGRDQRSDATRHSNNWIACGTAGARRHQRAGAGAGGRAERGKPRAIPRA